MLKLISCFIFSILIVGDIVGETNIVDLTHTLTPKFPYIPVPGVTFPFQSTPIATIEKMGVAANKWEIHEHLGTQIDAPSHFIAGGLSLDQMPVKNFIAPLVVIDISERAKDNVDAQVSVEDIKSWEKRFGMLPEGAAVFMHSGWSKKVDDPIAFINADESNTMHFPGFAPETAAFLIHERQITGIGVDTLSIDPGRDKDYKTHKTWLGAGKWAVECVANLDQIPPAGATVFVGAVKVGGATGGPVRLIATFESASKLAGTWKSPKPERIGSENYTTREFKFTEDWWQVKAIFYSDQEMRIPLFSFVAEGPFRLANPSSIVPGATDALFSFSKKSVTLLSSDPAVLSRFNLTNCNLVKDIPKDISITGCSFFTSISECGQEYDLVKIEGNALRLGVRPPDRNMCTQDRRPKGLGLPVTKIEEKSSHLR